MDFNAYQNGAMRTAIYPRAHATEYVALGLASEAGEVAGKVKKLLRDGGSRESAQAAIGQELGDVLWYCAAVATEFGLLLDEVAKSNLSKLESRMERGKIGGSGDQR